MKILFIKPPQEGFFHTTERHYPTGLLYLAEACREKNYEIDLLDCLTYKNIPYIIQPSKLSKIQEEKISNNPIFNSYVHYGTGWEEIEAYIAKSSPNVIGLSIMFSCFYDTGYTLAINIKKRFPEITIIAGGAHISILYRHSLDNQSIDYCLRYEGENTLPLLLDALTLGKKPYAVPGIAFRDSVHPNNTTLGGYPIYCNDSKIWIDNLDVKTPAYDLVDYSQYDNTVSLITSRGCPYACSFCSVHLSMGKKFRYRSVECVVEEIEKYWSLGVRNFNIEDDNFSLDIGRAEKIFYILEQKGINASFRLLNGIIASNVTNRSMHIFARAGVKKMFFGLETTSSQRLQELKKKHTSLKKVKRAIYLAEQNHIQAGVSLIIGFPNQSLDQLLDEIATLIRNDILILAINPLYPIPETQMYQDCINQGVLSGCEDFITLGGDNFPIHNELLSQIDLYYIWIAIRALCKWNTKDNHYLTFNYIQTWECLKIIANAIGECTVENTVLGFKFIIPLYKLHNEIYSAGNKILMDMITSMIYIRTNCFMMCTCSENDGKQILCLQERANINVPNALFKLRVILNKR